MKKLAIILSAIFVSLITTAVFAIQSQQSKPPIKSPRGFYMANFSSNHDMDITYEHCTSGKCGFEDIRLSRVDHGKNMQWVSGASFIFSVTEIDEAGNAGKEIVLNGCSTQSTENTFTNMVALIDIPGTKMIGCIPMITHDPSMPLGQ